MNVDLLSKYNLPQSVLEVLSRSKIKHVLSIIDRRGPLEAAFTMKELREIMNLSEASMVPVHSSLLAPLMDSPPLTRQQSRILQLIQQSSKNPPSSTLKTWSIDFLRSHPAHFHYSRSAFFGSYCRKSKPFQKAKCPP